ncbi:hypothetical protein [Azospirillum argentinense]|uniref:hypothetical protein n=1 Tax=Azospirillum argentinense TaxID=2970906 RepID=UPI001A8FBD89|nr:hypothetical protein [Azospirillum argentinense]
MNDPTITPLDLERIEALAMEWASTQGASIDRALERSQTSCDAFFEGTRIDSRSLDQPVSF